MSDQAQYIKEIERYFIELSGQGIMLSSEDYAIITDLRDRHVPKEVVLRGISRAFSELEKESPDTQKKIRNLKQCRPFIEKSAEDFSPLEERKTVSLFDKEPSGIVGEAARRLSDFINAENRPEIRDYYINLRNRVLSVDSSNEENILGCIINLESESLDLLFSGLADNEKESILNEARTSVERRGRYMTEKAFSESIISFRNEIIHNRYRVKNLFGYDQG